MSVSPRTRTILNNKIQSIKHETFQMEIKEYSKICWIETFEQKLLQIFKRIRKFPSDLFHRSKIYCPISQQTTSYNKKKTYNNRSMCMRSSKRSMFTPIGPWAHFLTITCRPHSSTVRINIYVSSTNANRNDHTMDADAEKLDIRSKECEKMAAVANLMENALRLWGKFSR